MSSNTLFNECRACKMKFENSEQLANHVRKFCTNSDYADPKKLEEKYQSHLRIIKDNFKSEPKNNNNNNLANIKNFNGKSSIEELKGFLKSNDDEFKKLEKISQRRREEEMEEELHKLKVKFFILFIDYLVYLFLT